MQQLGPVDDSVYLLMDRAYEGDETRALATELGYIPVVPPKSNRKILGTMISSCTNSATKLRGFFVASKGFAVFSPATINLMLSFWLLYISLLLLMPLCEHYLVLDDLQVHRAKKVVEYLSTVEGRFEFVFTPKHASWLNLIESFFSKMTRQMLKGIRVKSREELIQRIYSYFDEINAEPVVFHWTWHLDDIDPRETVNTETLLEMDG